MAPGRQNAARQREVLDGGRRQDVRVAATWALWRAASTGTGPKVRRWRAAYPLPSHTPRAKGQEPTATPSQRRAGRHDFGSNTSMAIGLISDTHDDIAPWAEVLPKVAEAFEGVELILHCGDLTTPQVLDDLAHIAPVVAVRSAADPPAQPPRLVEGPQVLDAGGLVVGLVNALGDRDPDELFGRAVDVVVHGGTHEASVETRDDALLVNPGSPTLANQVTVAVLDTHSRPPQARIIPI